MTESGQAGGRDPDTTVSSAVEVAVDPDTAFAAFTSELDLWWVRGPINHHAAGRALAMRCEPGVGGRLLEVYDDAAGDALELARITVWEPGKRLAWQSSIDDVSTDITFEPCGAGCVVRVQASIPADGQDRGGTSWVRVTPKWFGPWCARRDRAPAKCTTWPGWRWAFPTPGRPRPPGGWPRRSVSPHLTRCQQAPIRCPRPATATHGSSSAWATARS